MLTIMQGRHLYLKKLKDHVEELATMLMGAFPRCAYQWSQVVTTIYRRVYANAHDYQVNSISYKRDGVTFISADELRINLWNQSNNIVDTKPTNMEDLTDVVKVLSEYRCKREKRFNIFCGFFIYLQPWKDNECLSL